MTAAQALHCAKPILLLLCALTPRHGGLATRPSNSAVGMHQAYLSNSSLSDSFAEGLVVAKVNRVRGILKRDFGMGLSLCQSVYPAGAQSRGHCP